MNLSVFASDPGRPREFGIIGASDPEWLESTQIEQPLFPSLPIIDPHHHLWDHPGLRYLVADYAADAAASGHAIEATVYADCVSMYRNYGPEAFRSIGETEFLVGQAAIANSGRYGPTRIGAAMFGSVDLRLGAQAAAILEAHIAAGNGRFRGVRAQANYDPSGVIANGPFTGNKPGMLTDLAFQEGARQLAKLGLVLDVWVFFHQLEEVAALAAAVPDLIIVLDHCGGPLGYGPYAVDQEEHYKVWRTNLLEVAKRPNVMCKVGGIMGRGAAYDYIHAERPATSEELARIWAPWFEPSIEAFGPDRSMFESNYPVEKMGVRFDVLWNCFKRIAQSAGETERAALFSETARRIYRIEPQVQG